MALIRRPRDGALLVCEGAGPAGEVFHRPLGGHVEVGERAAETIEREMAEEIGQALTGIRLAGVLENIFTWAGETQHEVVFVFSARFADETAYDVAEQMIMDSAEPTRVIWRPAAATSPPLYPEGLADLLPRSWKWPRTGSQAP